MRDNTRLAYIVSFDRRLLNLYMILNIRHNTCVQQIGRTEWPNQLSRLIHCGAHSHKSDLQLNFYWKLANLIWCLKFNEVETDQVLLVDKIETFSYGWVIGVNSRTQRGLTMVFWIVSCMNRNSLVQPHAMPCHCSPSSNGIAQRLERLIQNSKIVGSRSCWVHTVGMSSARKSQLLSSNKP